jgi:hypothetical protein
MTHLCSVKVTHTKNTFSPVFASVFHRGGASINIIHAEGVALGQNECRHNDACRAADSRPRKRPFPGSSESRIRSPRPSHVVGHFWRANPGHFPRAPKPITIFRKKLESGLRASLAIMMSSRATPDPLHLFKGGQHCSISGSDGRSRSRQDQRTSQLRQPLRQVQTHDRQDYAGLFAQSF